MLPIQEFIPQIQECLSQQNNLVLQAEPGAGKSTALPLSLLDSTWLKGRKIVMLEPRRIAVKTIAYYLAAQLNEKVGQRIGYHIKNEKKVSKDTILEIVTEGILTRRMQNDSELKNTALIIFDEFHLRSIHADISLMLALEIQSTLRDDLKLMVMSATIDTQLMSDYMGKANIINCPGRIYPVATQYSTAINSNLSLQIIDVLREVLSNENFGDTLIFLPGQSDIKKCIYEAKKVFQSRLDLIFLPLYGALTLQQQEQALVIDQKGRRRIIFSTNIAETSLTIAGITCVIDSGLEKTLTYDPSSYMTRLETTYISKASAKQRKGRAGRTQAGSCYRLWNKAKQHQLNDFQQEEILSADLTGLVLELLQWGDNDFEKINWLTAPPKINFNSAITILQALHLIESSQKLTSFGKQAVKLSLTPRLSALLLHAKNSIEQGIACELAALLSEKDIFTSNRGSKIIDRMIAVQDYKQNPKLAIKEHSFKLFALNQLMTNANSFKKSLKLGQVQQIYSLAQIQDSIGKLLLYAYPDRLAKKRSNNPGHYQLANGKGAFLFDDDPLFSCEWLVIADCDAQKKEGRIYSAVEFNINELLDNPDSHIIQKEEYTFDKKKQKVTGRLITQYDSIEISSTPLSKIPTDKFQNCLLQILESEGLNIINWSPKCEAWIQRTEWLGNHLESFPKISKKSLINQIDTWLIPYINHINSMAELKKLDIYNLLLGMLSWGDQQILKNEAPTHYLTPGKKTVAINYNTQQGPSVSVILQEIFGELESPKIAGGNITLRFELLSPARRPIQTTSDLKHFWNNSYFEVIKDMKGRYPKHRWPDKPLLEKAGKSYKIKT